MECAYCGNKGAMMTYNGKFICIKCFTRDTQGYTKVMTTKHKIEGQNMNDDFEYNLRKAEEQRKKEREKFLNSTEGQMKLIMTDFKCWCYMKGKFQDLNENDFKKYKKENKVNIDFALEMKIFTEWFGYKFEFDGAQGRWKTVENKHWVLNKICN